MTDARRIIIDTDPGIDDALAIFLALASPEVEVVGLTTVFGNVAVDLCTRNALALLEIAGRDDIPVAAGAAKPLSGPYLGPVPQIHGADGQGDAGMPAPKRSAVGETAAEFLCRSCADDPAGVTIVAIGPLTNLALALRARPAIAREVREVVVMGGAAFVPGNATPHAEANIHNDPEAADLVFAADWPVVMVGLDVTHQAFLTNADARKIMSAPKAMSRHISKALPLYQKFFAGQHGLDGVYLHDPSAVAYVSHPSLFRTRSHKLRVALTGEARGKTVPLAGATESEAAERRGEVGICIGVDAPALIDLVVKRLG